jgi:hypothetical protein
MSTTLADTLGADDGLEAVWVTWIGKLKSWERNLVLRHELEWHDLFSSSEWTLADLEHEIAETIAAWR